MRTVTALFYAVASFFLGAMATVALAGYGVNDGYMGALVLLVRTLTIVAPILFLVVAIFNRTLRD
jgi:hypothetical protein